MGGPVGRSLSHNGTPWGFSPFFLLLALAMCLRSSPEVRRLRYHVLKTFSFDKLRPWTLCHTCLTLLLLWRNTVTSSTHKTKPLIWGLSFQKVDSSPWLWIKGVAVGIAENSHLHPKVGGKRAKWEWYFETSKPADSDTPPPTRHTS